MLMKKHNVALSASIFDPIGLECAGYSPSIQMIVPGEGVFDYRSITAESVKPAQVNEVKRR